LNLSSTAVLTSHLAMHELYLIHNNIARILSLRLLNFRANPLCFRSYTKCHTVLLLIGHEAENDVSSRQKAVHNTVKTNRTKEN
jgi:hypothetical protein